MPVPTLHLRYTSPSFYDLITERELTAEGGFRQRVVPEKVPESGMGAGAVSFHDFRPPSLVHISQEYEENGGKFVLALYACPTKPGWVRHIGCQVATNADNSKLSRLPSCAKRLRRRAGSCRLQDP